MMNTSEKIARRIPLSRPDVGPEEHAAMRVPIEKGWVTQGFEVEAFERELAEWAGASHACAVSSGTTALFLALRVAGVKPGDEVITVSHSFIATANSIRHLGAVPVFIDIDPDTYNMDPTLIEAAVTPKTKAILCVHQIGLPCDLEKILDIGKRFGLPVIEDAACALGSEVKVQGKWARIGRPHGDLACFSFHPRKIITTGDGGMVLTGNAEYAKEIKLLRNHGMSVSPLERHTSGRFVVENYAMLGFNFRLTDLQGAMGRVQLKRLPQILARRQKLAERYHQLLAGVTDIRTPGTPEYARPNWQSYCARLADGVDSAKLMTLMTEAGVQVKGGVMCSHREPAYLDDPTSFRIAGSLTHSERAQDRCMLLPLFSQMTEEEQDYTVQTLKRALLASLR